MIKKMNIGQFAQAMCLQVEWGEKLRESVTVMSAWSE